MSAYDMLSSAAASWPNDMTVLPGAHSLAREWVWGRLYMSVCDYDLQVACSLQHADGPTATSGCLGVAVMDPPPQMDLVGF